MAKNGHIAEVFKSIVAYHKLHGYMPTYREIGEMSGLSSSSSVYSNFQKLMAMGVIGTDDNNNEKNRAYRINGKWTDMSYGKKIAYGCSICGNEILYPTPTRFCPNCGARMESYDSFTKKEDKQLAGQMNISDYLEV